MTYKWILAILKIEMLKTSTSFVKIIGQRFVIKGTLNRKVSSGRPRASTIKDDHRITMNVLKDIRKRLLSTANKLTKLTKSRRVEEMGFLSKICGKMFSLVNKSYPSKQSFKPVIVVYCGSSGATRTNFAVQCVFNYKHLSNSLHS